MKEDGGGWGDGSRGEVRMGVDILGLLDDDSCIYSSFSLLTR